MVHKRLLQHWTERVLPMPLEQDCPQFRKSRRGEGTGDKYGVLSMARQGAGSVVGPTLWTCIKELAQDNALTGSVPGVPFERGASRCLAGVTAREKPA
eukprot:6189853-Pyramimonas_sp.AAC.1